MKPLLLLVVPAAPIALAQLRRLAHEPVAAEHALAQPRIAGGDDAALGAGHGLDRVEAERGHLGVAARSHDLIAAARAQRLRAVLDDRHLIAYRLANLGHRRGQPGEVDRTTARVRGPVAAAIVALETFQVSGSMSANRGWRHIAAPQLALAAKVIALVTISSPSPRPAAKAAPVEGRGSRGEGDRVGHLAALGKSALESLHVGALCEPIAAQGLIDRGDVVFVDRLASVRDRHGRRG